MILYGLFEKLEHSKVAWLHYSRGFLSVKDGPGDQCVTSQHKHVSNIDAMVLDPDITVSTVQPGCVCKHDCSFCI